MLFCDMPLMPPSLSLQSRAVPIIVNVYITINRIGGAPVINVDGLVR